MVDCSVKMFDCSIRVYRSFCQTRITILFVDPDIQVTWTKSDPFDPDSPGHPAWLQC